MSRGGRGGGRGGRPKIAGFEYDPTEKFDTKPSELFPPYQLTIAEPPTEKEKREVAYYVSLRDQIHQGPFYTIPRIRDQGKNSKIYGEDQFNEQHDNRLKVDTDPFDGVPRYTWRYKQETRIIPQLSDRHFEKTLFPEELWSTLEGDEGVAVRRSINGAIKRKAGMISGSNTESNLSAKDKTQKLMDKIKSVVETDDADPDAERNDEDEDPPEEEADYDFEEDDDEMGGDYHAEQYFDGGDADEDDGGDAGGGDDY